MSSRTSVLATVRIIYQTTTSQQTFSENQWGEYHKTEVPSFTQENTPNYQNTQTQFDRRLTSTNAVVDSSGTVVIMIINTINISGYFYEIQQPGE